jgi:hypothetical protein
LVQWKVIFLQQCQSHRISTEPFSAANMSFDSINAGCHGQDPPRRTGEGLPPAKSRAGHAGHQRPRRPARRLGRCHARRRLGSRETRGGWGVGAWAACRAGQKGPCVRRG